MKKRRIPYHSSPPEQNLDSFLDIMTNTVGALMFISLFITLVTVQSAAIIRTPLLKTSDKKVHLFELQGDRAYYVDTALVQDQVEAALAQLPDCRNPDADPRLAPADYLYRLEEYQFCIIEVGDRLQNLHVETEDYQVKLINLDAFAFRYDAKTLSPPSPELTAPFAQHLQGLDPHQDYVAFIVRPDAFPTFRTFRQAAWKEGFDVGWEPLNQGNPLILSNRGRSIGVQ